MSSEARDRLRQISLFDEIRDHEESMGHLEAITQLVQVPAGTTVIKEGEVGSEMYVVFRGQVEIKKQTRAGDDYTVVKLDASQNVFFGELALVDDDKRSATVLATEDSEFLVITKKDFARLGETHPEIALPITRAIARMLAGRLRKTTVDMLTIFDALVSEIQE
ncbi:MAG: cyclic nucleotide-binding domain-containing protein [Spirochaetaceae bacterium]